ncbi:3',5'-cyclic-AMP phosphodiesterase [Orbaceae bacterium ac157xtp]
MKTCLSIQPQHAENGRIIHITDTHLFAQTGNTLMGVNTNASFQAVIDQIFADDSSSNFDLIVATGDFVQDGSEAAYNHFAKSIQDLNLPCVYIPGNHDKFSIMNRVFSDYGLDESKTVLFGDKWVLILLNSQVEDKAYGFLQKSELDFLDNTLERFADRKAMIFLHHHPVSINSKWLDEHSLKNSEDLKRVIAKHKNVKSIGCGHIHQQLDVVWQGCHVFATPSTCFQFKPASDEFKLDVITPGWRIINLNDHENTIDSKVYRLNQNLFLPDTSQNGY